MPQKRKKIKEEDFDEIAKIILSQMNVKGNKNTDPDGLALFGNKVACRSIREKLADYFNEHFIDFDYWGFISQN